MAASAEWLDIVYSRLQALGPEEWLQLGPLFDEVRLKIPFTAAMRLMIARLPEGEIPNGDKAQWLAFTARMCHMGVEFERKGRWREYSDKVRLQRVQTCDCGGPVIKVRMRQGTGLCLACRNKVPLTTPTRHGQRQRKFTLRQPRGTFPEQPHVKLPATAFKQPQITQAQADRRMAELNPQSMATQMIKESKKLDVDMRKWRTLHSNGSSLLMIQVTNRRKVAVAIRNLLPMARKGSINYIVRELERSHDDIPAVLRKYGITDHQQLVLWINNRYMLEQLGLT